MPPRPAPRRAAPSSLVTSLQARGGSNSGTNLNTGPSNTRAQLRPNRPWLNNSIYKLHTLHPTTPSAADFRHSARGFTLRATEATAAHIPSYLYWLLRRGGINFEESFTLCQQRRILLNGAPLPSIESLYDQLPYGEFEAMAQHGKLTIVNGLGDVVSPLERANHRSYFLMHFNRRYNVIAAEEDPYSFIHQLPLLLDGSNSSRGSSNSDKCFAADTLVTCPSALQLLAPPGFVPAMRGVIVATNDATLPALLGNANLGNYGIYELRFHAGTPSEVLDQVEERCRLAWDRLVSPLVPPDLNTPVAVWRCGDGSNNNGCSSDSRDNDYDHSVVDIVARTDRRPLRPERLLLVGPRLPLRLWRDIRRFVAIVFVRGSMIPLLGSAGLPPSAGGWSGEKGTSRGTKSKRRSRGSSSSSSNNHRPPAASPSSASLASSLSSSSRWLPPLTSAHDAALLQFLFGDRLHLAAGSGRPTSARPLTDRELLHLYATERRLKANKVLLGLRALQTGSSGTSPEETDRLLAGLGDGGGDNAGYADEEDDDDDI